MTAHIKLQRVTMTFVFLLSFSLTKAQNLDSIVESRINELKSNSIDSIIYYYEDCVGEQIFCKKIAVL